MRHLGALFVAGLGILLIRLVLQDDGSKSSDVHRALAPHSRIANRHSHPNPTAHSLSLPQSSTSSPQPDSVATPQTHQPDRHETPTIQTDLTDVLDASYEQRLLEMAPESFGVVIVVDEEDRPIEGARVLSIPVIESEAERWFETKGGAWMESGLARKTNEKGRTSLLVSRLDAPSILVAKRPGFSWSWRLFDPAKESMTTVRFCLRRAARVQGRVLDGIGEPLVGAVVWQSLPKDSGAAPFVSTAFALATLLGEVAYTDADGRFELEEVAMEGCELTVLFNGKPRAYEAAVRPGRDVVVQLPAH